MTDSNVFLFCYMLLRREEKTQSNRNGTSSWMDKKFFVAFSSAFLCLIFCSNFTFSLQTSICLLIYFFSESHEHMKGAHLLWMRLTTANDGCTYYACVNQLYVWRRNLHLVAHRWKHDGCWPRIKSEKKNTHMSANMSRLVFYAVIVAVAVVKYHN